MVFLHPIKPGAFPAGIKADSTVMWYKKDGRNRKVFLAGTPLHYFHVADCGMDRGGIISRRYSRWRSTAEDDLCTAKLGLTKGKAPPGETEKREEVSRYGTATRQIVAKNSTPGNDHPSVGCYWL